MTGEPAAKKQRTEAEYDLIYWPGIPGRGEPIRLMFEEAGVAYTDTSQQKKGVEAVLEHISPSFTTDSALNERIRLSAFSLSLSALDLQNECHDTHHPIANGDYYEDQKEEALRKAKDFREVRLPKFFGYFERVIKSTPGPYLLSTFTYADLVLFHVVDGVNFAFPKVTAKEFEKTPAVKALHEEVLNRKNIKTYLASERRNKYSSGVYRHYPELDAE